MTGLLPEIDGVDNEDIFFPLKKGQKVEAQCATIDNFNFGREEISLPHGVYSMDPDPFVL